MDVYGSIKMWKNFFNGPRDLIIDTIEKQDWILKFDYVNQSSKWIFLCTDTQQEDYLEIAIAATVDLATLDTQTIKPVEDRYVLRFVRRDKGEELLDPELKHNYEYITLDEVMTNIREYVGN